MKTKYKFIHFTQATNSRDKKADTYQCRNNRSGEELGIVKWYAPWRQLCYFPTVQAVYSGGCLEDINSFIKQLIVETVENN